MQLCIVLPGKSWGLRHLQALPQLYASLICRPGATSAGRIELSKTIRSRRLAKAWLAFWDHWHALLNQLRTLGHPSSTQACNSFTLQRRHRGPIRRGGGKSPRATQAHIVRSATANSPATSRHVIRSRVGRLRSARYSAFRFIVHFDSL
jgi:hypothetical protein